MNRSRKKPNSTDRVAERPYSSIDDSTLVAAELKPWIIPRAEVADESNAYHLGDRWSLLLSRWLASWTESPLSPEKTAEEIVSLKEAILRAGEIQNPPAISHEGEVLEGRHRLKVLIELRANGHDIRVPLPRLVRPTSDHAKAEIIVSSNTPVRVWSGAVRTNLAVQLLLAGHPGSDQVIGLLVSLSAPTIRKAREREEREGRLERLEKRQDPRGSWRQVDRIKIASKAQKMGRTTGTYQKASPRTEDSATPADVGQIEPPSPVLPGEPTETLVQKIWSSDATNENPESQDVESEGQFLPPISLESDPGTSDSIKVRLEMTHTGAEVSTSRPSSPRTAECRDWRPPSAENAEARYRSLLPITVEKFETYSPDVARFLADVAPTWWEAHGFEPVTATVVTALRPNSECMEKYLKVLLKILDGRAFGDCIIRRTNNGGRGKSVNVYSLRPSSWTKHGPGA